MVALDRASRPGRPIVGSFAGEDQDRSSIALA
jgi:hypothetical protein